MPDIFAPSADVASVRLNDDMRRIERIPRRLWGDDAKGLAVALTELLKTPRGSMALRPIQAAALADIGTHGGLFGPLRVGSGKTLISLLAPVVAFAARPLLLVPAGLVDKTKRDESLLRQHWDLPEFIRIMSYDWLGRVQAADALDAFKPDMIICDEVHKLKNPRAAVTRRVVRYMRAQPDTQFVGMSGTITKRSIHDFAHILAWCVKNAPLPRAFNDLELWANALDERKGQVVRADPGALRVLCDAAELRLWEIEPRQAARKAFRRRLIQSPGVVASKETSVDASLQVRALEPPSSPAIDEAFHTLRNVWKTPDGWPVADGLGQARHAKELALGFYYVWDPRPPRHWLTARTEWCAYVRRVLSRSRTLDSEKQVRNRIDAAIRAGKRDEGIEFLANWREVKDDFEPNTVPRWISDSVIELCVEWMKKNNGIVWTEHTCFAKRIEQFSHHWYYGRKGRSSVGLDIEAHPTDAPLIASIQSNGTGRNLQAWHRNLITSMPANGLQTEQLIGRTHREGQLADEVSFDIITACAEHVGAFWQARRDSVFVYDATGSPQKILLADIDMPTADSIAHRNGARWDKEI